jgi:integrase
LAICCREAEVGGLPVNVIVDNDVIVAAAKIKTPQGGDRKGDIRRHEYDAIRKAMDRAQERYLVALWETGWRLNEPKQLRWANVDFKKGVLQLAPEAVKEDYPRVTPISDELLDVLNELKEEQRRVPSVGSFVFTRSNGKPIKSIRKAFKTAAKLAGIPNAIPHDTRRSTIRRWEALGISRQAVMQATGRRPATVHEKYAELAVDQLLEAFQPLMQQSAQRVEAQKSRAAL